MTIVSIVWWPNQKGRLTRGNKEAFVDAGFDVEVTDHPSRFSSLIFTPMPGVSVNLNAPLVTQFGGYGPNLKLPASGVSPKVIKTFKSSNLVTVIDPNMARELWSDGVDEKTLMIPNSTSPPIVSGEPDRPFTVFNPMGDASIKKPEDFIKTVRMVGEEEPEIEFKMVSKSDTWNNPIEWLGLDNLGVLPTQSYENMLALYSESDLIAHFSSAEICPWSIFEAFELGKPVIAKNLGLIQTVGAEHILEMIDDFNMASKEFDERWLGEYWSGEGDHFLHAETPEELADTIMELYNDKKRRLELRRKSIEWASQYGEWQPRDKGKAILEAAGIA